MRRVCFAFAGLVGGSLAFPVATHAHEKWFVDASAHPTSWAAAVGPPGIVGVVAIALTVIAGLAWRAWAPQKESQKQFGFEPEKVTAVAGNLLAWR